MLDNRRMAIVEDDDVINYQPRFVIDGSDLMRYAAKPLAATGVHDPGPPCLGSAQDQGELEKAVPRWFGRAGITLAQAR